MNNMERADRHRTSFSHTRSHRKSYLPRALLFCSATAIVALSVGVLLFDSNAQIDSVIESDPDSADHSLASTDSPDGDDPTTGQHPLSGSTSAEQESDPYEDSIQGGEALIAETNSALAANPLPSKASGASSEEYQSEARAVREEIARLRNELRASQQ